MVAISLITVCFGFACLITESTVDYDLVQAAMVVQAQSTELSAAHARLNGFDQWLTIKTRTATREFLASIEEIVNPILKKLKRQLDGKEGDKSSATECYNVAVAGLKQMMEEKMPSITACTIPFSNSSETNAAEIPERVQEIIELRDLVDSIMTECESQEDRLSCITERTNSVATPVSSIESFVRITVEKGHGDYFSEQLKAAHCLSPIFEEIDRLATIIEKQGRNCMSAE